MLSEFHCTFIFLYYIGDFEVTVNGQKIFSKQENGNFPDVNNVSLFIVVRLNA